MKASRKYAFIWVTLGLFLFSLAGHWLFAWFSYVSEQEEHNAAVQVSDFLVMTMRDTLENWQSEFLQLVWQVGALAFLWFVGSPQSKESSERTERKIDFIMDRLAPDEASQAREELERKFPKS